MVVLPCLYFMTAVYDESRRNFDYFANIKSAAAGNKVMLFLQQSSQFIANLSIYLFHSVFIQTRSIFKNSRVYFDSNESLPDASSILAAKLLEKIYALSSLECRAKFQLNSSFRKHKILVVLDHLVDRATVKANKANLMNPAREILDDEIFYAGSQQHYNILLLPKAATASNLSSVGGNSTSSAVIKVHSVAELVGAEYMETSSHSKPFSDWCKGFFDYFFYYYNCELCGAMNSFFVSAI